MAQIPPNPFLDDRVYIIESGTAIYTTPPGRLSLNGAPRRRRYSSIVNVWTEITVFWRQATTLRICNRRPGGFRQSIPRYPEHSRIRIPMWAAIRQRCASAVPVWLLALGRCIRKRPKCIRERCNPPFRQEPPCPWPRRCSSRSPDRSCRCLRPECLTALCPSENTFWG